MSAEPRQWAVTGARIIDGTGKEPLDNGTILIRDGMIVAVGPGDQVTPEAGTPVVDVGGRTVIPGLIDAHVHLSSYALEDPRDFFSWRIQTSDELQMLHGVRNAFKALNMGFCTLRNMGGADGVAMRDAFQQGILPGPRLVTSGNVGMTAGHSDLFTPVRIPRQPGDTADGPAECRKAVRERVRMGADFIKICTTGGVLSHGDQPHWRNYSPEEIAVITDEAHALDRRVAAHAQVPEGIKNALRNGVDTIEHGCYLDDECIELLLETGAYLVPTLAIVHHIATRGEALGVPHWGIEKARRLYEDHKNSIARAYEAGVKIAVGTDAAGSVCPFGSSHALELELLVGIGMSPMEALVAATSTAAACIGLGDKLGTLEPGRWADLVVVDGDPLADIRILQDEANIVMVAKEGKVLVDRAGLSGRQRLLPL